MVLKMVFKARFHISFLSIFILLTPLKATEEENTHRIILRKQFDPRALSAFTREPLEAQLARNLGRIFQKGYDRNFKAFISFLNSPDFRDMLWYDDEARNAYQQLVQLVTLASDHIQTDEEYSLNFNDIVSFFGRDGYEQNEVSVQVQLILSVLDIVINDVTSKRQKRFSKLPEIEQDRILTQAIQIEGTPSTPEELTYNLGFLFKFEFKNRLSRLCSFLHSMKFIQFLREHPTYREAYNRIAIQRTIQEMGHTNLRGLSDKDEFPLFRHLSTAFGNKVDILQLELKQTIYKSLATN